MILVFTAYSKKNEKKIIAKCWNHILSALDNNSDSDVNVLQKKLINSLEGNVKQKRVELLEIINPNLNYSTEYIVSRNKVRYE